MCSGIYFAQRYIRVCVFFLFFAQNVVRVIPAVAMFIFKLMLLLMTANIKLERKLDDVSLLSTHQQSTLILIQLYRCGQSRVVEYVFCFPQYIFPNFFFLKNCVLFFQFDEFDDISYVCRPLM